MKLSLNAISWLQEFLTNRLGAELFLEPVGCGYSLTLCGSSEKKLLFVQAGESFPIGGSSIPCTSWNANSEGWDTVLEAFLPMPGKVEVVKPLIEIKDNVLIFNYDLPGLIWWVLSRAEEVGSQNFDEHGRFLFNKSHAYLHNYINRPFLDEWIFLLSAVLQKNWGIKGNQINKYNFQLSHDVDVPSKYKFASFSSALKRLTSSLLRENDLREFARFASSRFSSADIISTNDPYNTFDFLMSCSERFGVSGVYYFICGGSHPEKDADYRITDLAIRRLMHEISCRGNKLGLHPSYETFLSSELLKNEAQALRKVLEEEKIDQEGIGARMHYLRWRMPDTLRGLEEAGLAYDASLYYAGAPGFRAGTCHKYKMFDPVADRSMNIEIDPLILMDVSLLDPAYLGLNIASSAAYELFDDLKNKCKAVKGNFNMLWHNTQCITPALRRFYVELVERGVYEG